VAEGLPGAQGQGGGVPVARAGKAEDARGEGGGKTGGFDHDAAAAVFFPGQEGDVKAAAEKTRITGPCRIEQRAGLIERAKIEQLVDARGEELGRAARIRRGVRFGEKQRQQQAAQGWQAFGAFGGDEGGDVGGAAGAPERCG